MNFTFFQILRMISRISFISVIACMLCLQLCSKVECYASKAEASFESCRLRNREILARAVEILRNYEQCHLEGLRSPRIKRAPELVWDIEWAPNSLCFSTPPFKICDVIWLSVLINYNLKPVFNFILLLVNSFLKLLLHMFEIQIRFSKYLKWINT